MSAVRYYSQSSPTFTISSDLPRRGQDAYSQCSHLLAKEIKAQWGWLARNHSQSLVAPGLLMSTPILVPSLPEEPEVQAWMACDARSYGGNRKRCLTSSIAHDREWNPCNDSGRQNRVMKVREEQGTVLKWWDCFSWSRVRKQRSNEKSPEREDWVL